MGLSTNSAERYGRIISRVTDEDAVYPVNIALLKKLTAIDFPDHDDLLELCIRAATARVEEDCGISLALCTVTASYEYWVGKFPLPFCPLVGNVSAAGGVTFTLSGPTLTPRAEIYAPEGVELTYKAGWQDATPEPLKLAILKEAATQFEVREYIALGTISSLIPGSYLQYVGPYRTFV